MYPDFRELLLAFNANNVEYLIVGAHAPAVHGHVRATNDLDLWALPRVLFGSSPFSAVTCASIEGDDYENTSDYTCGVCCACSKSFPT